MIDKYVETMDKLAQDDKEKGNPEVMAYRRTRELISKALPEPESEWVKRLKKAEGYKTESSDHYLLLHNVEDKYRADLKSHLDRCEEAYKTFYYWLARHPALEPDLDRATGETGRRGGAERRGRQRQGTPRHRV